MSNSKSHLTNTQTLTTTQTQRLTAAELERRIAAAGLSGLEERALRMRYGIALELDAELEFADEATPEAKAAIIEIERRAVAHLRTDTDAVAKQEIIDELRKL